MYVLMYKTSNRGAWRCMPIAYYEKESAESDVEMVTRTKKAIKIHIAYVEKPI